MMGMGGRIIDFLATDISVDFAPPYFCTSKDSVVNSRSASLIGGYLDAGRSSFAALTRGSMTELSLCLLTEPRNLWRMMPWGSRM